MPDSTTSRLDRSELIRLRALRDAASEMFHSGVVASDTTLSAINNDHETRLLQFMSALRRTYSQGSDARFLHALMVLSDVYEDRRAELTWLRVSYNGVLVPRHSRTLGMAATDVFEAWLFGSVSSGENEAMRQRWESIVADPETSELASLCVERWAAGLAHHVVALDDLIAEFLHEDRLPSVEPFTRRG